MTTDLARGLCALIVLAVPVVASLGCGSTMRRPDGLDVATLPEDVRHSYDIFEVRCSRCHSLARPLNADIDDPAYWEDYVRRMRRQPGSGISRADAADILRFLRFYTAERIRREREEDGEQPAAPETPAASAASATASTPESTPSPPQPTPAPPPTAPPSTAPPPATQPTTQPANPGSTR